MADNRADGPDNQSAETLVTKDGGAQENQTSRIYELSDPELSENTRAPSEEDDPEPSAKRNKPNEESQEEQTEMDGYQREEESLARQDRKGFLRCNIGDELKGGRYKIEDVVGEGGYGRVYRAYDKERKSKVALKIIKKGRDSYLSGRLEVRNLQHIGKKDPNNKSSCLKMIDWFDYQGHICISSGLQALDLGTFKTENDDQPFNLKSICCISFQLCNAVAFLHANHIIHTDIKLDNVLLVYPTFKVEFDHKTQRNRRHLLYGNIYLTDFGLAIFDNERHKPLIQTRPYRAPEVVLKMPWSHPCDVWSVGVCILQMFLPGDLLLDAEDNLEHLSMLEYLLGPIPRRLIREHKKADKDTTYFRVNGKVNLHRGTKKYKNAIKDLTPLSQLLANCALEDRELLNLLILLLKMDPRDRLKMSQAKDHAFFERLPPNIRNVYINNI